MKRRSWWKSENVRHLMTGGLAVLAALAMLAPGVANAGMGIGGGGVSGGGSVGPNSDALWLQDNSNYASAPAQGWGEDSITYALSQIHGQFAVSNPGTPVGASFDGRVQPVCRNAVSNAIADPTDGPATQARVVGIMMTVSATPSIAGGKKINLWGTNGTDFMRRFHNDWNAANPSGSLVGWDSGWLERGKSMFEAGINAQAASTPSGIQVVCLAVNNQQPPRNYDLGLTTSQQMPAGVAVGATNGVHDLIHASRNGSPIAEDVNAAVTLHYGGQPDGYVSAKESTKTGAIHNDGDSLSPSFSPSDLGMTHWQEGQYWFDVNVGKQGKMNAAVSHQGSADASEQWSVSSLTPAAPTKSVQKGTSANGMANMTTIESNTGRGGYEMHFKDVISSNGIDYDVSDMKVTDTSANADVSGQFTMNWDKTANTVTADRSKSSGELPLDHVFRFTFKVTVHDPDTNMIGDKASVAWNRRSFVDSPYYRFPTRNPNPDKAWTTDPNEALATSDPNHTNQAGSDARTFVPGDRVSSVVNGTLPKGLVEDLSQYSLTDDWSDASRYLDFPNENARVYVDGIDRSSDFDITTTGFKTTAVARQSMLTGSAHQVNDRAVKLVLDGSFKSGMTATDAVSMTNSGGEQWNGQDAGTNTPPVFVRSPNPDKVWVKDTQEAFNTADRRHTDDVAADNKTYVTGDDAVVVVNGTLPKNLARDLSQYAIVDDWSQATRYADFPNEQVKVYVDGVDRSGDFDVETSGHVTTASAKTTILNGSGKQAKDRKVKMVLSGTMLKDLDAHTTATIVNKGSEQWNGKTVATNMPQVHVWSPNPDKSWVRLDGDGKWKLVVDPNRSNATGADNLTFLDGDQLGAVINLPISDPSMLEYGVNQLSLTDDYAKADYLVDPQALSKVRVYMAPASSSRESSVDAINDVAGSDISQDFNISKQGTKVTATAKPGWLAAFSRHSGPVQITMLVPFVANYANGKGAAKVREDFHKNPGDELVFGTDPGGADLLNAGSILVNRQSKDTNLPKIYGYVPSVKKDVVSEASQGGDQGSVDGKVVYPGQKVEYDLDTQLRLPSSLAYAVKTVALTDCYDRYLKPDKQTLELMDLNSGHMVPKSKYVTKWNDTAHEVMVYITDTAIISRWQSGGTPRLQLRFEGTVSADAPADHKVGNQWMLTLNNSVTPSNEVFNVPPALNPAKHDFQSSKQGDPTVSIDGRTLLLGDSGNYVIDLDATQTGQAYKVWKLGIVDDFDEEYLKVDPTDIAVTGDDGQDYTARFNIGIHDGVLYVFAKRVDTFVAATGTTLKGEPQPEDLQTYAFEDKHDPLSDPAIDQSLLGQHYHIVMPYIVQKVSDGYVVRNKAIQIENTIHKETNEVSNPLKPLSPEKDVVVRVGGESVDGSNIYKDSAFLYQLDSSVLPANRAYPRVDEWNIVDDLNPDYDQYTGQWAVYATRDLRGKDGSIVARKGERIAGNGFDSIGKFGSDLFTLVADDGGVSLRDSQSGASGQADHVRITVTATEAYRQLVSHDTSHEQGWRTYIQVRRMKPTERHENKFVETLNTQVNESNVVWTRTPDLVPSLHIEKWDKPSGWSRGDRDDPNDPLNIEGDTEIVFTITNTSDNEGGHGALFKASDLKISDTTLAGDGAVTGFKYPAGWPSLVLKPGEHVDVVGTLKDVTARHMDRAKVTGIPLVDYQSVDTNPWAGASQNNGDANQGGEGSTSPVDGNSQDASGNLDPGGAVSPGFIPGQMPDDAGTGLPGSEDRAQTKTVDIEGRTMSVMQPVASNLDDWNGVHQADQPVPAPASTPVPLVVSGASITLLLLVAGAFLFGAILLEVFKCDRYHPRHR
ncbi:LPXTG cell wall anchor domain-containing protein [Bifidobacterium sp. ESL0728]|uniref:LPXTG cell wall anchor domain-containing protein n=1 Tax=Bifidobacterium sp. ESL0728 TaxID=2983220 RepID=UPI0023FA02D0|nr:LPXTG cell wall anchor domain-containing protein [Bifidobacterium sp. ESL0728]WEV59283.1 LPXTG cell wall anchor domain-containing protein [Bifidobacterium sp. ESL0728]